MVAAGALLYGAGQELVRHHRESRRRVSCPWCDAPKDARAPLCEDCLGANEADPAAPADWPRDAA